MIQLLLPGTRCESSEEPYHAGRRISFGGTKTMLLMKRKLSVCFLYLFIKRQTKVIKSQIGDVIYVEIGNVGLAGGVCIIVLDSKQILRIYPEQCVCVKTWCPKKRNVLFLCILKKYTGEQE